MPSREIQCNDCFMVERLYYWEENVEAKEPILWLPDEFCKRQILIWKQAYDEIDQDGVYDGKIVDCQLEFKVKDAREMDFQKRCFAKQDRSRQKTRRSKKL